MWFLTLVHLFRSCGTHAAAFSFTLPAGTWMTCLAVNKYGLNEIFNCPISALIILSVICDEGDSLQTVNQKSVDPEYIFKNFGKPLTAFSRVGIFPGKTINVIQRLLFSQNVSMEMMIQKRYQQLHCGRKLFSWNCLTTRLNSFYHTTFLFKTCKNQIESIPWEKSLREIYAWIAIAKTMNLSLQTLR